MSHTLDRRSLLKLLGCGGCAVALPTLSGCSIAEVFGGGSATVPFDLAQAQFAGLKNVGGTAAVDAAGRNLILIRTNATGIVALSRICTHTACDMATDRFGTFDGQKLICRCHDSHFAPTGAVLKGPATRDLASYQVNFDAATGTGTVQIGDGAPPVEEVRPTIPDEYANLSNPFAADDADAIAAGEALYARNACGSCHGDTGGGDGPSGMSQDPKPSAFAADQSAWSDGYLFWRIRTGSASGPTGSTMPVYGTRSISDDDTWRIVSYLRSLQP